MPTGKTSDPIVMNFFQTLLFYYTYVTGPAKRDQVGTKYIISQNDKKLEYCLQYLLSVTCVMLPMELLIHGKTFTYIASADH